MEEDGTISNNYLNIKETSFTQATHQSTGNFPILKKMTTRVSGVALAFPNPNRQFSLALPTDKLTNKVAEIKRGRTEVAPDEESPNEKFAR